ncbi:hypothetical protein ACI68E_001984 [Malassezia pachydermatis]|uniref:Uncharacterized protein n=1 Tax=Malassezia pachydermatis TaxID=77020 RepID=A0A0M9VPI9_9BASI|nr:hypothetical protein Malapachy_1222 [Malassezia pachydermatis]KOS14492.1 hypothetical protein Malapachy_1222 [Malassezia pachydermatis]
MSLRVRRQEVSCRSKDIYLAPAAGAKVSQGSLNLTWKPDCIKSSKFDVYIYSQHQSSSLPLHAWLGIPSGPGAKSLNLQSSWWNSTQDFLVNLQFVPSGSQPWESPYPLSPSWTMASGSGGGSSYDSSAAYTNSKVTEYDHHSGLSTGSLAAAIVVPIVVVLATLAASFYWWHKRHIRRETERIIQSSQAASTTGAPSMMYGSDMYASGPGTVVSYGQYPQNSSTATISSDNKDTDSLGITDTTMSSDAGVARDVAPTPVPKDETKTQKRQRKRRSSSRRDSRQRGTSSLGHSYVYDYDRPLSPRAMSPRLMDNVLPATREEAEEQRRSTAFRSQPRFSVLEMGQHTDDHSDFGAGAYELPASERPPTRTKSPVLAPAVTAKDGLPAVAMVPTGPQPLQPEREPFTFMDGSGQRRVSSTMVGSHSREEKVLSYLATMQGTNESMDTSAERRRSTQRASMGSRLSLDSDAFQDAFSDMDAL